MGKRIKELEKEIFITFCYSFKNLKKKRVNNVVDSIVIVEVTKYFNFC